MATTKEIQTLIDTQLSAWLPLLGIAQENVKAKDGRYFQGLCSHTAPPKDAAISKGSALLAKPLDRADSWSSVGLDPRLGAAVSVDEYLTPDGECGYVVNLDADINGKVYRKCVNYGPEKHREQGWQVVVP